MGNWCPNNDVLTAEIYWTLYSMEKHFSFKSFDGISDIFGKMFPSCPEAQKFSCGERKASYVVNFGLAPYFHNLLAAKVKKAGNYVLLFDESLNHHQQQKQLDVHIRFWDEGQIRTRFLTSKFLGHGTSDVLFKELEDCCSDIGKSRLIQLSMDGPNVNWATYEKLSADIEETTGFKLYNIGSCGLHIIHNAFKKGYSETSWHVDHALNSLYWLFKDTPARREDFVNVTGCSLFPKQFCGHRWLENVDVCERAIEMWPHVINFVNNVKKSKNSLNTKSFNSVVTSCDDVLFTVKLNIFMCIAKEIYPFLLKYQTDSPVLPYFVDDMQNMIVNIICKFAQKDVVKQAQKSIAELISVCRGLSDAKNHKASDKIDCGFVAEKLLNELVSKKKISDGDRLKIKLETKNFLIHFVTKIAEKAPIRYGLVRNLGWLKPDLACSKKDSAEAKFRQCLNIISEKNRVNENKCDGILQQYRDFVSEMACNPDFKSFSKTTGRLDHLYFSLLSTRVEWADLWSVVKDLLILSHGQASVERGFSINKEISVENMSHKTLISRRAIKDHLNSVGGASNVHITKELLFNVASARSRYEHYLQEEKTKKDKEKSSLKRQAEVEELECLKTKRKKLESCAQDLEKSADEYAEKAENTQKFSFIAKSNALRKSAKDKYAELKQLNEKINEICKKLKE